MGLFKASRVTHVFPSLVRSRHVQSGKMVHAALLLLMLEAASRTSFHHQPEAQHPKILSCPQERRPITPSLGPKADIRGNQGRLPISDDNG
jgi:hypothetical protein